MLISVKDQMPKPNVQLRIESAECGGAAMLGEDGKWYWTFNGKKTQECSIEVTHWEYLKEDKNMEKQITTYFPGSGTFIVTENAEGRIYTISAEYFQDILDDWNGDCNFVPANDARVFFAAWNGEPLNPYSYHDFESLIQFLKGSLG